MSAQVAADLRAAADVLERDGWTQGRYHSDEGCHCVMGAIATAVSGNPRTVPELGFRNGGFQNKIESERYWNAIAKLRRAIDLDADLDTVHEWNDYQAENADQVITALRAAADRAEAS